MDLFAGSFLEKMASVGIAMSRRAEMIAAILAVLKYGARYVLAEPDFSVGRIRYMMEEAEVDFILTEISDTDKLDGFDVRLAKSACFIFTWVWITIFMIDGYHISFFYTR